MGDVSEDEWSLILAETPGLKRHIEENEAFERAQLWGGLFRASEAYFVDGEGDADSEEVPVGESSVGGAPCMVRSSWGSVDARVAPMIILGVVVALCMVSMIVVSLFMFVGGVVFGG
jgi:hypothetical protein